MRFYVFWVWRRVFSFGYRVDSSCDRDGLSDSSGGRIVRVFVIICGNGDVSGGVDG